MSLDDITVRILNKLDSLESKIDNLCTRQTKTETELNNHFKDLEQRRESNNRRFYIIMALMSAGFALYEITKGLLS